MTQYNKIHKNKIEQYLNDLSKEYKKLTKGKVPGSLIIVGGASIALNYSFREATTDADSIIECESPIKDAIKYVAKKYNLPEDWLNSDFKRTKSYNINLGACSEYYKVYNRYLTVYTVKREYLIAMKLMSGREYKNDLSDIVGILKEHYENNDPISYENIEKAIIRLYGSLSKVPIKSLNYIKKLMLNNNYLRLYDVINEEESLNKDILLSLDQTKIDDDNVDNTIIKVQTSILIDKYIELGLISNKKQPIKKLAKIANNKLKLLYQNEITTLSFEKYSKKILGKEYIIHMKYINEN